MLSDRNVVIDMGGALVTPVLLQDVLVHGAMILSEPNLVNLLLRTLVKEMREIVRGAGVVAKGPVNPIALSVRVSICAC